MPIENWHLRLVGLGRFELPTSRLSSARSNQLSYKPMPGIGDQQTAIRLLRSPTSDDRPLAWLVREEREMKTAVSRQWASSLLRRLALMFPRDPIKTRE